MPLYTYKVVLNTRFGGFSLSRDCVLWLSHLCKHHMHVTPSEIADLHNLEENRTCQYLVEAVERNAQWAGGAFSKLVVDTVYLRWSIEDYDGREQIYYGY